MKRLGVLALAGFPALCMAQANVEEPSYHYLEVGLIRAEFDMPGPDLDGDGYTFEYSVPVREHVHLFGGYETIEIDDVDGDSTRKQLGLGVHFGPTQRLSVFGRLALTDVDVDFGGGNVGDDGYALIAGIRYLLPNGFEIRAGGEHYELDDSGSDTFATIGADFFLTDVAALTLDIDDRDGTTTTTLALRFYFDNDLGSRRR